MPMPDDRWAKGKCALKALQYMSMSIPTIASAVGANNEVISHGENGLLATTKEDWINQLTLLVDNPSLRARLGNSGRRTVEDKYSTEHCAAMFADVVRKIVK
jgi:glycosyltransferase involved in cell wall biosynthesis